MRKERKDGALMQDRAGIYRFGGEGFARLCVMLVMLVIDMMVDGERMSCQL